MSIAAVLLVVTARTVAHVPIERRFPAWPERWFMKVLSMLGVVSVTGVLTVAVLLV